jgi:hypothetical protein
MDVDEDEDGDSEIKSARLRGQVAIFIVSKESGLNESEMSMVSSVLPLCVHAAWCASCCQSKDLD